MPFRAGDREKVIAEIIRKTCLEEGIGEQDMRMGSRARKVSKVRAMISCYLVQEFGMSKAEIAGIRVCAPLRLPEPFRVVDMRKCQ